MFSLYSHQNAEKRNITLHMVSNDKNYLENYIQFIKNRTVQHHVKATEFYTLELHDDIHDDTCNYHNGKKIVHLGFMRQEYFNREHENIYYIGNNYFSLNKLKNHEFNEENIYYAIMFHYNRFDLHDMGRAPATPNVRAIKREIVILQNNQFCFNEIIRDYKAHSHSLSKTMTSCGFISANRIITDKYYADGIVEQLFYKLLNVPVKINDENMTLEERKEKYTEIGNKLINTIQKHISSSSSGSNSPDKQPQVECSKVTINNKSGDSFTVCKIECDDGETLTPNEINKICDDIISDAKSINGIVNPFQNGLISKPIVGTGNKINQKKVLKKISKITSSLDATINSLKNMVVNKPLIAIAKSSSSC